MPGQFYNFNQGIIGRATANDHAMRFHAPAKFVVELVAMPVTLKNNGFTISLVGLSTRSKATDPVTKAHGTTFIGHLSLRVHQVNDGIGGLRIKFRTVSLTEPQYIARKLNDRNLHPQTQPQVGFVHATSKARRFDLTFDTTMTKPSWYDNTIQSFQDLGIPFTHVIQRFRINPFDMDIHIMIPTGMTQCFRNREVRVV